MRRWEVASNLALGHLTNPAIINDFLPRDAMWSALLLRQVVCPSARNVEVPWSHRLDITENHFTVLLAWRVRSTQTPTAPRGTPRNYGRNRDGVSKKRLCCIQNSNISEMQRDRTTGPRYYWGPIGSHIHPLDWRQNQRPWMTLKGHYALCFNSCAPWCCYLFIFSFTFSLLLVDKWPP